MGSIYINCLCTVYNASVHHLRLATTEISSHNPQICVEFSVLRSCGMIVRSCRECSPRMQEGMPHGTQSWSVRGHRRASVVLASNRHRAQLIYYLNNLLFLVVVMNLWLQRQTNCAKHAAILQLAPPLVIFLFVEGLAHISSGNLPRKSTICKVYSPVQQWMTRPLETKPSTG